MPNWASCSLLLEGAEKDIQAFQKTMNTPNAQGEIVPFSFHQTVPRPPKVDWYEWNIAHWGSKWDGCEVEIVENNLQRIFIRFQTAWSPPTVWLELMIRKFPGLTGTLAYCEVGMQYYGCFTATEDKTIKEDYKMKSTDTVGVDTNGNPVNSDDDAYDIRPGGELARFMKKHSLENMGG